MSDCPFCTRYHEGQYDTVDGNVMTFVPLNPVTSGHRLFVPTQHMEWDDPGVFFYVGLCVVVATDWAYEHANKSYNVITSNGVPATQTIPHVHVHLVPRREGDGLVLPWT